VVLSSADCAGGQASQAIHAHLLSRFLYRITNATSGLKQRHSGTDVRGPRVPFLREPPHSYPPLLQTNRFQASATKQMKSLTNRDFLGTTAGTHEIHGLGQGTAVATRAQTPP
jgi:hypothetical protein